MKQIDTNEQSIQEYWTEKINKELLGRKITKIEYLTQDELDDNMWDKSPIAIELDNRIWLVPMADDEGNDGGSISTNIKNLSVIPTI
tara:strand:- start:1460 stop:1720 length:261 start_codon:yes stop_codon:yes gene_type:complete